MTRKMLAVVFLALSLLLSSCNPELSVQQYDKLKTEIVTLEIELRELRTEFETIEVRNTETLAYVEFLNKLLAAQSTEITISGQFDVEAVIEHEAELTAFAENLDDGNLIYYLGLLNSEDKSQAIAAYYKVIEYSLKKMKKNLE